MSTTIIAALVKALEPFAKLAEGRDHLFSTFGVECDVEWLRTASAALARAKQQLDLDRAEVRLIYSRTGGGPCRARPDSDVEALVIPLHPTPGGAK